VTALDVAGNTATSTVAFSVAESTDGGDDDGDEGGPTTQTFSVDELIRTIESEQFKNKGIERSLIAKLEACQQKINEGQYKTAINILNAFKNQVLAQLGKHIPEELANGLIDQADELIDALNGAI